MFGLRLTRDVQKRWKKGKPPHTTTGVASANSSHGKVAPLRIRWNCISHNMEAMAIASRGAVSARLIQNRRLMSRSSGFSSSPAVTVRGSSAMPQIGHDPGSERTIAGCMGQVYSVRLAATGSSGSSAMPHEGQAPGFGSRTSGHIGHTYAWGSCRFAGGEGAGVEDGRSEAVFAGAVEAGTVAAVGDGA